MGQLSSPTAAASSSRESAPASRFSSAVVWLFAFVIPAVGLVRGPVQGALAGLLSEPALRWIETGAAFNVLDPQTPFGFLILVALGTVPAYLLSMAMGRRVALDAQLKRVEVLLGVRDIAWSAMLHDVGKLRVPDRVLLKPGRLTEEEWGLIRQHPAWGEELLSGADGFALARAIVRSHHENWDGTGYPDGRAGEAIPFAARIVRIVDVFDALRSDRPYKPAWSPERTLDEMQAMRGRGFDPELADLFLELRTRTS